MNEVALNYLPNAFCFIYVINSTNAGGVQEDRVSDYFIIISCSSLIFLCCCYQMISKEKNEAMKFTVLRNILWTEIRA